MLLTALMSMYEFFRQVMSANESIYSQLDLLTRTQSHVQHGHLGGYLRKDQERLAGCQALMLPSATPSAADSVVSNS